MTTSVGSMRPALEVAEVIRQYGEAFREQYGSTLTAAQRQALRALAVCRTAVLGGHVLRCVDCGSERIAYNSCRNRHCPKCQALARARWLEREGKLLLPVPYYHVVFTLPEEVAELALANRVVLYNALFQAASATLRDVAANPKRLGAQLGVLLVLHTWGQNLHHHPHVHGVVTGGGLACNERGKVETRGKVVVAPAWRACRPGFFLPVRVLSQVFREPHAFVAWLRPLYAKDWIVYAKKPFGGPAQVLKYLARYTHRVAISNSRLLALTPSPLGTLMGRRPFLRRQFDAIIVT